MENGDVVGCGVRYCGYCWTFSMPCNRLLRPCRKAESRSRRRYRQDGFDLDLVYLTPQVIVSSFPVVGLEYLFRNPRSEVRRLLETYHSGQYNVFNFCCETDRRYDPREFDGHVSFYPFNIVPTIQSMIDFTNAAKEFLDENTSNIILLHCDNGQDRSGLMCCILLLRCGIVKNAKEALSLYDSRRVTNNCGLTAVHHRKYVVFYEQIWRKLWRVDGNLGFVGTDQLSHDYLAKLKEPKYQIFGVDILNLINSNVQYAIQLFHVDNTEVSNKCDSGWLESGITSYDCDYWIQGNFMIQVYYRHNRYIVLLLTLTHNTLFIKDFSEIKNPLSFDFHKEQLEISSTFGQNVTIRLRLTPSISQQNPIDSVVAENIRNYSLIAASDSDQQLHLGL